MTAPRLRILQVLTHGKINAGGAVQAWLLSRELVRLGHSVTMAFAERTDGPNAATVARVTAIGCRYAGLRLSSLGSIRAVRDLLRQGFDVVHLHRELALQRFLQAAPLSPAVGAVANVGTSKLPSPARARRLRSQRIDRVVVVAEALKRLLVRTARVEPTRIEVVYGAYDEERFAADVLPYERAAAFGVPAAARLVGLIGNLDPKKGHRVFVHAARHVLDRRDDCWFVCAGKGNRGRLDRFAEEAGVPPERILFLGFRDDVPRLLKSLDVSVCASTKGEGLTGSLREAMALGVPVVSTALAGNVEIVRQGETGLLVAPRDARGLAAAIQDVLDDPAAAAARAENGRVEVQRFTSRRRADQMARLYEDVRTYRQVRGMAVDSILYPSN